MRRAGAHSLLLGEFEAARPLFEFAAAAYYNARFPYHVMMDILAGQSWSDSHEGEAPTRSLERFNDLPHQEVYYLLATAGQRRLRALEPSSLRDFSALRSIPLGVLRTPLGDFFDLATALERREGVSQAVAPFLQIYNRAIERAMANDYQWKRLGMPFHPAEPDIISVLQKAMESGKTRLEQLLASATLNETAAIVLGELLGRFD